MGTLYHNQGNLLLPTVESLWYKLISWHNSPISVYLETSGPALKSPGNYWDSIKCTIPMLLIVGLNLLFVGQIHHLSLF